jgi:hypothetical protein
MSRLRTEAIAPVSFWAVGKLAETSQVAIKINDLPPVVMSAEDAQRVRCRGQCRARGQQRSSGAATA